LYFPPASPCHAFPLPFQQETALKLGNGPQHGDHQLAGRSAGVDLLATHAEHDKADATAVEVIDDPQEVRGAPGKAIWLARYQRVTSADKAQGFLQPIPLSHGGNLLQKNILATGRLQIAGLGI
jgi:hypothetical protein